MLLLSDRPARHLVPSLVTATLLAVGCAQAANEGGNVRLDVPYVPTPQVVVDRMLELGKVDGDDYVIDLGSGDGRIAVTAASRYGARAMGVDLNPQRIAEANENAKKAGVTDKVEFKNQDLFDTPIGEASVLTMYLLPSVNMQLRPRILSELEPGTRVVSHAFSMEDWEADHQEKVDGRTVYLWIVPAQVGGSWKVSGNQNFELELEQQFQKLQGTAKMGDKTLDVEDGKLEGKRITFTVNGTTYNGRVEDQKMTGDGWSAVKAS